MTAAVRLPKRALLRYLAIAALPCLVASCGGGGGGGTANAIEQEVIKGQVFDGYLDGAIVCADADGNGHCDSGEAQTRTNAAGGYELLAPKGYAGPLVAEVVAGQSRDADEPGVAVDRSYRMASPARGYSTNITPFATLVRLTRESNFALAEELVRNELGLPPKFEINLAGAPAAGSLTQAVGKSIVNALKATPASVDYSSAGALATVVSAFPAQLTTLPTVRIDTKDAAPIVSKEIYVDATFVLTNPATGTAYPLNGKIRGRGHSTWGQPKNPYKIQLKDDASLAALPDVLGMPRSRNWVLLADWFDRSLLRNKLAFSLGNGSAFSDGMPWNPSGQHVEVTLNGDYIGVYLLSQDIRLAADRVDIRKMSSNPAANEVDGGYIVEVDWHPDCYNDGAIDLNYLTVHGVKFCINTPDEGSITPAQLAYVKNLLFTVDQDVWNGGATVRINPESFVDWYLLNELFKNNDAQFWSSVYMWKDTAAAADPKRRLLNLGPIWDFDISAGNINYNGNWDSQGCWVSKSDTPNWLTKLFDNPDFLDLTLARWKQKRSVIEKFVDAGVDAYARRLEPAQQRNFVRWPTLGVQLVNYYTFATYAEEVAFLKRFLAERIVWLDKAFASRESFAAMCR